MRDSKALAIQALLLTGAVVRIEIRKAGLSDPDLWWLGHLDSIAELLLPSIEAEPLSPAGEGAQETTGCTGCLGLNGAHEAGCEFVASLVSAVSRLSRVEQALRALPAKWRDARKGWFDPDDCASQLEAILSASPEAQPKEGR
jgi:hypothetical protein